MLDKYLEFLRAGDEFPCANNDLLRDCSKSARKNKSTRRHYLQQHKKKTKDTESGAKIEPTKDMT